MSRQNYKNLQQHQARQKMREKDPNNAYVCLRISRIYISELTNEIRTKAERDFFKRPKGEDKMALKK